MLINSKDYKINVLILFMEGENEIAINTIETLMESIEEGIMISVLLNGGTNAKLREFFSKYDCIRYYESESNLGVAGGRNFLLRIPECKNSDIVFILDNDVIPPLDYIRKLATFLLQQDDAGIVGAAIADMNFIRINFLMKYYGDLGKFGNKIFKLTSKIIKEDVLSNFVPNKICHLGIHPNYCYAYFSIRYNIYGFFRRVLSKLRIHMNDPNPSLHKNENYLKLIKNGVEKYPVSNVAGCSQAFRRKLIERIGYLDERQNPYGLEDVDFSIRSLKAGYRNYIDTSTWLFHKTNLESWKQQRGYYREIRHNFRSRTILASSVFPNAKSVISKLILAETILDLLKLRLDTIERLRKRLRGLHEGLDIINEKAYV